MTDNITSLLYIIAIEPGAALLPSGLLLGCHFPDVVGSLVIMG